MLLATVRALNARDIVPEVLTADLRVDPLALASLYGKSVEAVWRRVAPWSRNLPQESRTALFNRALWSHVRNFDLIFNSSNSLLLLPRNVPLISYVHYPRLARIRSLDESIHFPGKRLHPWSTTAVDRRLVSALCSLSRARRDQVVVSNSRFTQAAVVEHWGTFDRMAVVYPPVALSEYTRAEGERRPAVVSLGRFGEDKRQLHQLDLARRLPHLTFQLAGFTGDAQYLDRCRRYREDHGLSNVEFYADASFDTVRALLSQARYFIHTLENEPFGITAVQAIASGCIPFVHDSGGQRETVPLKELRFSRLEDAAGLIREMERRSASQRAVVAETLRRHARSFDESEFLSKVGELVDAALRRGRQA